MQRLLRIALVRWVSALAFVGALLLGDPASADEQSRVALVIGNGAYEFAPKLDNPVVDAKAVAAALRRLGFDVREGYDLTSAQMRSTVKDFADALSNSQAALIYYAGHGVETHGLDYLVPVDANPRDEADVFAQMVGTSEILDLLEKSGTGIKLVLLDACRDNPFRDRGVRSTAGGLAQMAAPVGTLISFATQPRSVSLDGADGHSPYTRALVAAMQRPGSGLFRTFNDVGLAVDKATQGRQLPWVSSSAIAGNFYFAGKPATEAALGTAEVRQNSGQMPP